jgi:hypothetical protein
MTFDDRKTINDLMVCYIDLQQIIKAFQNKKNRQMQLSMSPRPRHN